MARGDTKVLLLDAAERLFAEHGFAATSLRQLTSAASANLAAVNYHFGSKEALAKAVLARRIEPIQRERLRRLDALGRNATVTDIVRAFVEPPLRTNGADGTRLCRVFGRISTEQPSFLRTFLTAQFREVGSRFERALGSRLPGIDAATIWWRLHFVVGAMAHTLQNSEALAHVTGNRCRASDVDSLVEQLVVFATGGMKAGRGNRRASRRERKQA